MHRFLQKLDRGVGNADKAGDAGDAGDNRDGHTNGDDGDDGDDTYDDTDFRSRGSSSIAGLPFVDLFCGVGGASTGAAAAGLVPRLAVDSWKDALDTHSLNHPECEHVQYVLPIDENALREKITEIRKRGPFVIHGSPPCTILSRANSMASQKDIDTSVATVDWYLRFAISLNPTAMSFEQVANKHVIDVCNRYKRRYPKAFDFEVFDFSTLGVPQHRVRVIGGTPKNVIRLRRMSHEKTFSKTANAAFWLGDAKSCPSEFLGPPKTLRPAKKFQIEKRRLRGCERPKTSIYEPTNTVTCSSSLMWLDADGNFIRTINAGEVAKLQTFPTSYKFTGASKIDEKLVGNSLPPLVMQRFYESAIGDSTTAAFQSVTVATPSERVE